MNKKKILYYSIMFLTGFVVAFCGGLQIYGLSIINKLNGSPVILILCVGLSLLWALLVLITSTALLFKEDWRESAFLMFAGTDATDELEQAAVNDSIKKTFLLNLLILVSVVVLSGFTYTKPQEGSDGKKNISFSYRLMNDYEEPEDALKALEGLDISENIREESQKVLEQYQKGTNYYLIPKVFFTPYGILCFILLQFVTFRTFLYFNRKRFM